MNTFELPNGLRVVLEPMPYMRSVSMGIYVDCGSAYENKLNNGISHFVEHLLFKGTKNRTAEMISEEADELGGTLNAYTAEECVCLYIKVLKNDVKRALELLCDVATAPIFDEDAIENEKRVIIEEILSADDNPEDAAQEMLMSGMLPNHPIGMPVLGSVENVESFNKRKLESFYNVHFVPQNMVLSVAGCFDESEILSLINDSPLVRLSRSQTDNNDRGKADFCSGTFVSQRDIGQLQLVAGFPCVSRYDNALCSFVLLAGVLAGDGSSRLFRGLREQNGLVYNVDATVAEYRDMGVFLINTAFSAENADGVKRIVSSQIQDVMEHGVDEKELSRAKKSVITALELETESTMSQMSANGKALLFGIDCDVESLKQKYMNVTNEDIISAARFAFSSGKAKAVALVGDCDGLEDFALIY